MVSKRKYARSSRPSTEGSVPDARREPEGIANIAPHVGDNLSAAVLLKLRDGPKRLSRLTRELAGVVSQRSLILLLRKLEGDGLVTSTMFADIPPRVEWDLTRIGHGLSDAGID
ncbi:transcriptional regulator [Bradyrhizobium sp. CSA207]|nr:transcriptional regulator [Bradyrhizobium sp. CSA207]